jgi:CMP-N,N'-diacetyllegionaminic acid synthase
MVKSNENLMILIPARGGSKAIPKKNIVNLKGQPLLAWTSNVALSSNLSRHVILSTDSQEVASIGKSLGLSVPFLRPPEFAKDDTLQIEVIKHALTEMKKLLNLNFDSVMLLQPTTPFRKKLTLLKAYESFINEKADTLITVSDISRVDQSTIYLSPKKLKSDLYLLHDLEEDISAPQGTLRQDFRERWWRNGAIYIFNSSTLLNTNSLYGGKTIGLSTDLVESINIDTFSDLNLAKVIALGLDKK